MRRTCQSLARHHAAITASLCVRLQEAASESKSTVSEELLILDLCLQLLLDGSVLLFEDLAFVTELLLVGLASLDVTLKLIIDFLLLEELLFKCGSVCCELLSVFNEEGCCNL